MKRKNDVSLSAWTVTGKDRGEDRRELIRAAVFFAAGFIFAGGRFIFGSAPFGAALLAASSGFVNSAAALCGVMFGCIRAEGGASYALASICLWSVRFFMGRRFSGSGERRRRRDGEEGAASGALGFLAERAAASFDESVYVRMAMSSATALAGGAVYALTGGSGTPAVVAAVASSVSAPVFTFLFFVSPEWERLFDGGAVNKDARGAGKTLREAGSVAVKVAAVLSVSALPVPVIDPGIAAAYGVTVITVLGGQVVSGVICGVVCGVLLAPSAVPLMAVCALACGALKRFSGSAAVMVSGGAGIAWSIYSAGFEGMAETVPALIVTSAALAPLARFFTGRGGEKKSVRRRTASPDELTERLSREGAARRLSDLSDGFSSVSKALYGLAFDEVSPSEDEARSLCERAFMKYCADCGMRHACLEREAEETDRVKREMARSLSSEGRVSAAAVPASLARRCYNMAEIIDGINELCAVRAAESKVYDRTSVVAADYEAVSDVLRDAADTDRSEYEPDRELTMKVMDGIRGSRFAADNVAVYGKRLKRVAASGVRVSETSLGGDDIRRLFGKICGVSFDPPVFSIDGDSVNMEMEGSVRLTAVRGGASVSLSQIRKKKRIARGEAEKTKIFGMRGDLLRGSGTEPCGDTVTSFETKDRRLFMLISDGMGSGKEAAMTSGACAMFLERMLTSGAAVDTALKMVNTMIRARRTECSATVDLVEIDLVTGMARFVKSGAAPSFVIRGGRLFRLQSRTVPIGIIRSPDAETFSFALEPGDAVVMLSDGVAKSFEEAAWLYELLSDGEEWEDDPGKMAEKIVLSAVDSGAEDDVTAGVVRILPEKAG